MFCSQCSAQFEGQFCPNCGTKAIISINENKSYAPVPNQSSKYTETSPTNIPVKKGVFHYIKMFFWWYLCVSFIISGIAVLGIRVVSGALWFIGGIIICPELFKNYSTGIRFIISVILFSVGAVFMPA